MRANKSNFNLITNKLRLSFHVGESNGFAIALFSCVHSIYPTTHTYTRRFGTANEFVNPANIAVYFLRKKANNSLSVLGTWACRCGVRAFLLVYDANSNCTVRIVYASHRMREFTETFPIHTFSLAYSHIHILSSSPSSSSSAPVEWSCARGWFWGEHTVFAIILHVIIFANVQALFSSTIIASVIIDVVTNYAFV